MRAPQIIMICLFVFDFAVSAIKAGEPKGNRYNPVVSLITTAVMVFLLIWGGFFGGVE
jgi:hypothetical protein